jgi:hypothetical protein
MSKEPTHRFLLFDSACQVCSRLALEIEAESDWRLCAHSLHESTMQAWLSQARPGWCWEPTLLEVSEKGPRAFTGLGMTFRLVQVLGLRRAGRVARLVRRTLVPTARMHEERRQFLRSSGGLLLTLLGTSILAACGGSTPSSAPGPTSAPATKVSGEFAAQYAPDVGAHIYVGLSTDGQQVIAYACDGDLDRPITFAQWFKGSVTNNSVNLTNANGAHLVANLTSRAATGTVTLPTGRSFSFNPPAITDPASKAGLYRSEPTIGGVSYLAGWVITEPTWKYLSTTASVSAGLALVEVPLRNWCADCCAGGGILNEQTKQLRTAPQFTHDDLTSGQVVVSDLGTFKLILCRQGTCS